jgi:rhodanese-related sulfurtransferase
MSENTISLEALLEQAHERAEDDGLSYAGAFLPAEAHLFLQLNPEAKLVDVRTQAEHDWVGYIPGSLHIEWQVYPTMQKNPDFMKQLESAQLDPSKPVLFLCRSGGRSHAAATLVAANGFEQAYNIAEGFEGAPNGQRHRSELNGWKYAQLPWAQS